MKKIYEHNDKALKSYIVDDHQIDLKEASKEGLILDITNHANDSNVILFIKTREIKKIIKMLYENYIGTSKYSLGLAQGKLHYITCVINNELFSGKGYYDVHRYPDGEIIIRTFVPGKLAACQIIKFKSLNDILTLDHV